MKKEKKYSIDECFNNVEGLITYESLSDKIRSEVDELSKDSIEWLEKESLKDYQLNFRTNIFTNLFKYKPTDLCSPIENFTTESLAFLLRLSLESNKIFFYQFLSLIDNDIRINDDDVIHIETQRKFISENNELKLEAVPDITIIINTLYIFIEVKVGSVLNEEKKSVSENQFKLNQLVKYKNILLLPNNINQKKICTLTIKKETTNVGFEYSAITWTQVSSIIDNFEYSTDVTYKKLLSDFSKFLKTENMAVDKVEKSLNDGVLNLTKLLLQIKLSLTELNYNPTVSSGETYSGYYIEDKEYGFKLWVGYEYKNCNIKMQIVNKSLIEYAKEKKKYRIDPNSKRYILVSDLLNVHADYFDLDSDKQFSKLSEWLTLKINELKQFTISSGETFTLHF